jgi:hypothetical protein
VDLSALEATVSSDPTDTGAVDRLLLGYVAEGRLADARSLLTSALGQAPGDEGYVLQRALIDEQLALYEESADGYDSYLTASTGPFRPLAAARLDRVHGAGLVAEMSRRLAEGDTGLVAEPDRGRIAVLPFVAEGDIGLAEGLRWILDRELDRGVYEVVDRAVVRSILEGAAIEADRATELSAADLVMRMSGAGRALQGVVRGGPDGGSVSWEVRLVTALPEGRHDVAMLPLRSERGDLVGLMGRMVTALRSVLGSQRVFEPLDGYRVELPASFEALVALTSGIRATESGDWSGSLALFDQALQLEPFFEEAEAWRRRATAVSLSEEVSLLEVFEVITHASELRRSVATLRNGRFSVFREGVSGAGSAQREAPVESLRLDRLGASAPLLLILDTSGGPGP